MYFSKVQLVKWLPLSKTSSKGKQILGLIFFRIFQSDLMEKTPGKPLKFTGKSRENWVYFRFHSKQNTKRFDMNYYTVTLKSLTFQLIAILFKLFFLMLLPSWNTLFYYGTKNRLDFPPKLSESNFLAEFFWQKFKLKKSQGKSNLGSAYPW